jgi:hypothetical protein
MVLGVREKGHVHSRSQWTSRRQQELGSARLLGMFYQRGAPAQVAEVQRITIVSLFSLAN